MSFQLKCKNLNIKNYIEENNNFGGLIFSFLLEQWENTMKILWQKKTKNFKNKSN